MKQTAVKRFTALLVGLGTALLFSGSVQATPKRTRASKVNGVAAGVGQIMHMADYLKEHPGSRTAILSYLKMDSEDVYQVTANLRRNADLQERNGREFHPQIALETRALDLVSFYRELSQRGSQVDRCVRTLAREIALQRERNKYYFIRPFAEMNDGTTWAPWEFGNKKYKNTPDRFASAWRLLRDTFDEEGATNAIFIFSPLAAYGVHHTEEVLATLNKIPAGYIDAFSLNLYSRPMTAYGGTSPTPVPFTQLAKPWMQLLAKSQHRGIPLAIAEMAVSNQASDAQRAIWLRDAFAFARANGFVMLTYFNFPHRYWQIHADTQAGEALRAEMNRY